MTTTLPAWQALRAHAETMRHTHLRDWFDGPHGVADAESAPEAVEPATLGVDPDAPVGSIEPDGGFASALPETDELPEWLDPDPCKSPEAVAKLPGATTPISTRTRTKTTADASRITNVAAPVVRDPVRL